MRILLMIAVMFFGWLRVGEAQVHDGPHKFGKSIVNTPQGIGQKCEIPNCPEIKMVPVRKLAPVPTEEDKAKAPVPVPVPAPIPRPAFVPTTPNPGGLPGWQKAEERARFFFGKKRPPNEVKAPVDPETLDPDAALRQPNRDAGKEPYVPWFAKPGNGNKLQAPPQLPPFPPSQAPPVLAPLPDTGNAPSFAPRPVDGRPASPFLTPPFISPTPMPPPSLPAFGPSRPPGVLDLRSMPAPPGLIGSALPAILEYAGYATIGTTIIVAGGPYLVMQVATGMENTAALAAQGLALLRSASGFFVVRAVSAAGSLLVAPGCTSAGCAPRPSFPGNKAPSPFGIPGVQYPLQPRPKSWPSR